MLGNRWGLFASPGHTCETFLYPQFNLQKFMIKMLAQIWVSGFSGLNTSRDWWRKIGVGRALRGMVPNTKLGAKTPFLPFPAV